MNSSGENSSSFTYVNAQELIEEGERSTEGTESVMNPFMSHDVEESKTNIEHKTNEVNQIIEDEGFHDTMPVELKMLYKVLGNSNREFYINNWCLMSLDNVKKRKDVFLNDGQPRVVDFAVIYAGMGHCVVAAYDPQDQKVFYRHDGGSSGWDRKHYYDKIREYVPNDAHKYPFSHWLNQIKTIHNGPLYELFQQDFIIDW